MRGVVVDGVRADRTVDAMPTPSTTLPPSSRSIDWDRFDAARVDPAVIAVVRATCLLESRSDRYRDHLIGVLPPRYAPGVEQWAEEERHHGRALARWLALADPTFEPEAAMARFAAVPYHDGPRSDRGGPTQELVARCLVEAMASTFYLALADATDEPVLQQICRRLSEDERRHFRRFLDWSRATPPMSAPRRFVTVVRRLLELEDEQISGAAVVARGVDGRPTSARRSARRDHFVDVYSMHRLRHLDVAQAMVWEAIGARPPAAVRRWLTVGGMMALRVRVACWSLSDLPG